MNLGLQLITLLLILVGLRYAIKTHNAVRAGSEEVPKYESVHKNLMTSAVIISGLGAIIWMVPNFLLGWFYGSNSLGYGTGGYASYLEYNGSNLPH